MKLTPAAAHMLASAAMRAELDDRIGRLNDERMGGAKPQAWQQYVSSLKRLKP